MRKYIILFGSLLLSTILTSSFPFKKESDGYRVNVEITDAPDNLIHITFLNQDTKEMVTKEFTGESSIDISFTGSVNKLSFFYLDIVEFFIEKKRVIQHLSKVNIMTPLKYI